VLLTGLILVAAAACRPGIGSPGSGPPSAAGSSPASESAALRWVALGDSYTIGTSVDPTERWPDQLIGGLGQRLPTLELVANLAVNGYTSGDVIEQQLPALDALQPGFASLLIGVNDVVQGVPATRFEANASAILDDLLGRLPADRIVVVATPDYTVTPQGGGYGEPAKQAAGIVANNEILKRLARDRAITWVDIHDLSLRAARDLTLVASDGLHPSGAQYALWVERILPVVERLLGR